MIELRSKVTRKGQVTVPADVRKALGLKQGDRVSFLVQDGDVRLMKSDSVIARTAGALSHPGIPFPGLKKERELIERGIGEEAARAGLG